MNTRLGRLVGTLLLLAGLAGLAGAPAHAAKSETDDFPVAIAGGDRLLGYGKELYEEKGRCISCHGWAGDGMGAPHSAGNAANLRRSALTREQLIEVVSCGIPGSAMPHFNAFAYVEDRCHGLLAADIGAAMPPNPPRPLQQREIGVLVDYLLAKVVRQPPPGREQCAEFFGDRNPLCEDYAPAQPVATPPCAPPAAE